ncbi:MAG: hypothetical protein AAGB19_00460 [Cyanobacteria bacterium P01_F01_bin.3]
MPKATEEPKPVELPDWGAFQVAMFTNQAYQRVSQASAAQLAVTRLETFFSIQGEEWPVAVQLWGLMMTGVAGTTRPTVAEVEGWNAIATRTHMPIQFSDTGRLEVL